jgi:hypothetical protein
MFFFSRNTYTMAPKGEFMGSNFASLYYWTIVMYYNINRFINFIIRPFSRPIRLLFSGF